MNQQGLDLRRAFHIVWRHRILVGAIVLLGILGGVGYGYLNPPTLTSTAQVILPPPTPNQQAAVGNSGPDPYTTTQEFIASSGPVLSKAVGAIRPAISLPDLRRNIEVGSVTPYVISITATGKTAAQAVSAANAVAKSYVHYVNTATDPAVHAQAVLQDFAASATGTAPVEQLVVNALLGAIAGLVVGSIIALAVWRNDRRLRERNEIADSIGVSVLASCPVVHPSDAAGWIKLLEDYKPGPQHALQLRKTLQYLGMTAVNVNNGDGGGRWSVAVLSLSSDPRALALGPQLAAFAASQGLPTILVVGPQQDMDVTATLRTACAAPPHGAQNWPSTLRLAVSDGADMPSDAALTVVVTVVDGRSPRIPDMTHTTATLLAVSSGAATAEQLARVAVRADADDREITGILVADPEPGDHSTGRIPQLARPAHRRPPTRLKGIATEMRR
jgi:capsular polysaccharide biosynthesis protein